MKKILPLLILLCATRAGASDLSEWAFFQKVDVPAAGLVKMELPFELLEKADADLHDLRVVDPQGQEIAYFIDRPIRMPGAFLAPISQDVHLEKNQTTILLTVDPRRPVEGLVIETPARQFLKPVTVEGSLDRKIWTVLAKNRAVFREETGVEDLTVSFAAVRQRFFRLRISDEASPAIPVAVAHLLGAPEEEIPTKTFVLQGWQRSETGGKSQIIATLPYEKLNIASLTVRVKDPLFRREVAVFTLRLRDGQVNNESVAVGAIYAVDLGNGASDRRDTLTFDANIPQKQITIEIKNADNPALNIERISIEAITPRIVFYAQGKGGHRIFCGNKLAPQAQYDISQLQNRLSPLSVERLAMGRLEANPGYKPAETLPAIPDQAGAFDAADYRFRAPVHAPKGGVQRLTLGLPALSHGNASGRDLKIVKDGHQVPYILDWQGPQKEVPFEHSDMVVDKEAKIQRVVLSLPFEKIPVTRISCRVSEKIFSRHVVLYEEIHNDRGEINKHFLFDGLWTRTPAQSGDQESLYLFERPQTRSLMLEVEIGDNLPLTLSDFRFAYQPPRLVFKVSQPSDLWLYYGSDKAAAPRYDISLAFSELMANDKKELEAGPEEVLKSVPWKMTALSGSGRILFWAALVLVTLALFYAVTQLLPKEKDKGTPAP